MNGGPTMRAPRASLDAVSDSGHGAMMQGTGR